MRLCPLATINPCHEGATDIVPYAEDGTRYRGHRIGGEMEGGQRTGKAGILHAHLYRDSHTLLILQMQQLANGETEKQATDVVEHYDQDDKQATREQLLGIVRHDDAHYQGDGHRREGWQVIDSTLGKPRTILLNDEAQDDGEYHNLHDGEEHTERIDVNKSPRRARG